MDIKPAQNSGQTGRGSAHYREESPTVKAILASFPRYFSTEVQK